MQEYFFELADAVSRQLTGPEVYTCNFSAEDSDFVRFNRSQVRQAGSVTQRALTLELIRGNHHASGGISLSGEASTDEARLRRLLADLRDQIDQLPEDPHLLYATEVHSTERRRPSTLPEPGEAVTNILKSGRGRDLVGIYASGGIYAGFANSFGQRNWYAGYSFNLDWSFYLHADKAVKTNYAGFEWNQGEFETKVSWATEQLDALKHPARTISPGTYRVYLSPTALYLIIGMVCHGGFGLKAQRTKQTPLLKMIEDHAALHPSVTLLENTHDGVAPNFQETGFLRPDRVVLMEAGRLRDPLVSPRSAREYGVPTNGASSWEAPESIDMAGGQLSADEILRQIDTGIYVNNLWYLNFSDHNNCRLTGMTRFATYWVEGGRVVGPLNVMRFDETIYRMLGEKLVGLTRQREMLLDSSTYFQRSTNSGRFPGAVVDDFSFTL